MVLGRLAVRSVAAKLAQEQLEREIERWRTSGQAPTDYVSERLAPLTALTGRFVDLSSLGLPTTRLAATAAEAGRSQIAARSETVEELVRRAERARRRLYELEERATVLDDEREELEDAESEAGDRIDSLVERARTEADNAVAAAERNLKELRLRAEQHVQDVERRARAAQARAVTEARARFADREAAIRSQLERARIEAQRAADRAELAASRASGTAADSDRTEGSGDSPFRSFLQSVVDRGSSDAGENVGSRTSGRSDRAGDTRAKTQTEKPTEVADQDLDEMDRDSLYELARRRDIAGRSKMNKDELVEALRGAG